MFANHAGTSLFLLLSAAALLSCGDGVGPRVPDIATLTIEPDSFNVAVEDTLQLTATIVDSEGSTVDTAVSWSAIPSGIVEVDASGRVVALALGRAEIVASVGSVAGTAIVRVDPPPTLDVSPASATIPFGAGITLIPTISGSTDYGLNWSSSDEQVAVVDRNGRVTATGIGMAWVVVSLDGRVSVRDSTKVIVTEAHAVSLVPEEPTIAEEGQVQMEAIGFDGPVVWSSSSPEVTSVDANGLVTGVGSGVSILSARSTQTPSLAASTTVTVVVCPAHAPSIASLRTADGQTADPQNLRGEISVSVNLEITPPCGYPAEVVLLVDGSVTDRQSYSGGALQWHAVLDTRAWPNGEHQIWAEVRTANSELVAASSRIPVRFTN